MGTKKDGKQSFSWTGINFRGQCIYFFFKGKLIDANRFFKGFFDKSDWIFSLFKNYYQKFVKIKRLQKKIYIYMIRWRPNNLSKHISQLSRTENLSNVFEKSLIFRRRFNSVVELLTKVMFYNSVVRLVYKITSILRTTIRGVSRVCIT